MKNIVYILLLTLSLNANYIQAEELDPDSILLTIFLKHDQSKTLGEIKEILKDSKFHDVFPPKDTHVISWYVMMGIGQVVTLEVPPKRLKDVNLAIERSGWKAYRTEFYPTYDLYPVLQDSLKNKSTKNLFQKK